MYKCKYCNKEFNFNIYQKFGAHVRNCRYNPNRDELIKKSKNGLNQFHNLRLGELKEFKVICNKCGKHFNIEEREKQYPTKEKYFCSRFCANSRDWSDNIIKKRSDIIEQKLLNGDTVNQEELKYIISRKIEKECEFCKKIYKTRKKKQKCCSKRCAFLYRNKYHNICSKWGHNGGLKSTKVQKQNRRSKNEIYFSELCKGYFNKVLTNENIFNGWDADVIVEDHKIAVLWNGKWHYEKITKEHSVKQVQNRDKIKIKEIKKCGYKPYVIKDMGKYDKEFVESKFNEFIKIINCGIE